HPTGSEPGHEGTVAEHRQRRPVAERVGVGRHLGAFQLERPDTGVTGHEPVSGSEDVTLGHGEASHLNEMLKRHHLRIPRARVKEINDLRSGSEILASKAVDADAAENQWWVPDRRYRRRNSVSRWDDTLAARRWSPHRRRRPSSSVKRDWF